MIYLTYIGHEAILSPALAARQPPLEPTYPYSFLVNTIKRSLISGGEDLKN